MAKHFVDSPTSIYTIEDEIVRLSGGQFGFDYLRNLPINTKESLLDSLRRRQGSFQPSEQDQVSPDIDRLLEQIRDIKADGRSSQQFNKRGRKTPTNR